MWSCYVRRDVCRGWTVVLLLCSGVTVSLYGPYEDKLSLNPRPLYCEEPSLLWRPGIEARLNLAVPSLPPSQSEVASREHALHRVRDGSYQTSYLTLMAIPLG